MKNVNEMADAFVKIHCICYINVKSAERRSRG